MKKIRITMLVAVVALFMTGCNKNNKQQDAFSADCKTLIIKRADAVISESYPATIRGRQDVDIYPQVEGKIIKLCVEEGQRVRRGQVMFVIDQVGYRAGVLTAFAAERAAKSQIATAKLEYHSKLNLYNKKVVSLYNLLSAKNALETARASLLQARAQRINASNSLSYTVVKSPVDGVVGTLPYRIGALVSASISKPLTTVSDNSRMYVYFSMNETQLRSLMSSYGSLEATIKNVPSIDLMLNDGTMYNHKGYIEAISGVIDPKTGSASVRGVFDNKERMLFSGSVGNVVIGTRKRNAIIVPQTAVFAIQDKSFVYRLIHGKALITPVSIQDMKDGKSYLIKSGLNVDDVIIIDGVNNIKDGMSVHVKK